MKFLQNLILLSALIWMGCSSAKPIPYQAKWKEHTLFYQQAPTDETDMNSRLKFGVQNNADMLFASISTREPHIISRIISSGVKLSVYPPNEKKNGARILFPVVLKEDRKAIRKMDQLEMLGPSMQLLLDAYNKEAVINLGGGDRIINLLNNEDGLFCRINLTVDGELTIDYGLPMKYFNPDLQPNVTLSFTINDGGSRASGITPGISVGMGSYGGMGMGGMGVSLGTGGRNAYNNQAIELKLDVNLARTGS